MKFFVAPDAYGDPTIWERRRDNRPPLALFARSDFPIGPSGDHRWGLLVAAIEREAS